MFERSKVAFSLITLANKEEFMGDGLTALNESPLVK
jgi:hypothetical protein